jgi:hypothetical protein
MLAGGKKISVQATGGLGSRDDRPGLVGNFTEILKKRLSCEEGQNTQLAAPSAYLNMVQHLGQTFKLQGQSINLNFR